MALALHSSAPARQVSASAVEGLVTGPEHDRHSRSAEHKGQQHDRLCIPEND